MRVRSAGILLLLLMLVACARPVDMPLAPAPPEGDTAPPRPLWLGGLHLLSEEEIWVSAVDPECQRYSPLGCSPGLLLSTQDGGATWSRFPAGETGILSLQFLTAEKGWAAGGTASQELLAAHRVVTPGVLMRTADGGQTWEERLTTVRGPFRYIHFASEQVGWLATAEELWTTSDGGSTWRPVPLSDRLCRMEPPGVGCRFSLVSPTTGYLISLNGSGHARQAKALYRTDDGGTTWMEMAVASTDPSTWEPDGLPSLGYGRSLHFVTEEVGWITASRGGLWRTEDGGLTWSSPDDLMVEGVDHSEAANVAFLTELFGCAVIGGGPGELLCTANGGGRWDRILPEGERWAGKSVTGVGE